jgi:hypothetical protein
VSWRWIKVKKRGVLRVEGIDLPGGGSGWAEYNLKGTKRLAWRTDVNEESLAEADANALYEARTAGRPMTLEQAVARLKDLLAEIDAHGLDVDEVQSEVENELEEERRAPEEEEEDEREAAEAAMTPDERVAYRQSTLERQARIFALFNRQAAEKGRTGWTWKEFVRDWGQGRNEEWSFWPEAEAFRLEANK